MKRILTTGITVFALLGLGFGVLIAREAERPRETQTAYQRELGAVVTFAVTDTEPSADQITIIFAETSLISEPPSELAPDPVFGEEIVQEFSFSARDIVEGEIVFDRFVRDLSFVEAPYIRIVNHGSTPWPGGVLWLEIDGQPVFGEVPFFLSEQKDCATGEEAPELEGLRGFNKEDWSRECLFWEANLAELREALP